MRKKRLKKKIQELEDQLEDKRFDFNLKIRDYAGREFDRLIVFLSSGGLALTISYMEIFKADQDNAFKNLIFTSWILLFSALVLILVSQLTSMKSIDKEVEGNENISDYYNIATNWLNVSSFLALIFGVFTFILFIYKTL